MLNNNLHVMLAREFPQASHLDENVVAVLSGVRYLICRHPDWLMKIQQGLRDCRRDKMDLKHKGPLELVTQSERQIALGDADLNFEQAFRLAFTPRFGDAQNTEMLNFLWNKVIFTLSPEMNRFLSSKSSGKLNAFWLPLLAELTRILPECPSSSLFDLEVEQNVYH